MAYSMTGFARAEATVGADVAVIEISSVNHRFLDLSFRLPSQWMLLEPGLREIVKERIGRGKVCVSVRYGKSLGVAPPVRLDHERARSYIEAARELMHVMSSTDSLSLDTLIALDGVMTTMEAEEEIDAVQKSLGEALVQTLMQLNEARAREGKALVDAIAEHIRVLSALLDKVSTRAPELLALYDAKLRQRIAEINAEVGVKEERLALEVAMMADRMDVTEELVRFQAHLDHAREMLGADAPIGRDMNFLIQEIQREANTLGSKLRDVEVSRDVIEMKTEIEKIREQIQNLE